MPPRKRYQWNPSEEEVTDDRPSRSQKKRDSTALQRMGEELAALAPSVLENMPVSPLFRQAILEWQQMHSRESRRRQMQYIGRLMREDVDTQAVREALDRLQQGQAVDTAAFKQAERWREDLLSAPPAELDGLLTAFGEAGPSLRDLVLQVHNERQHQRLPHAFRALFRQLRTLAEAGQSNRS